MVKRPHWTVNISLFFNVTYIIMEIKLWPVMDDPPMGEMPVSHQLILSNSKLKEIQVILLPVLKNEPFAGASGWPY